MISSFVVDSIIILFISESNDPALIFVVVIAMLILHVSSLDNKQTCMWNVLLLETKLLMECSFCPTFSFILLFLNIIFKDEEDCFTLCDRCSSN